MNIFDIHYVCDEIDLKCINKTENTKKKYNNTNIILLLLRPLAYYYDGIVSPSELGTENVKSRHFLPVNLNVRPMLL